MLITGPRGSQEPEPTRQPRAYTEAEYAGVGRLLMRAVSGDAESLRHIESILAMVRRQLTPAEIELGERLAADLASKLTPEELEAEALSNAWPEAHQVRTWLVMLGDVGPEWDPGGGPPGA